MTTNTSLNNIAMGKKKQNILSGIGYPSFFFSSFLFKGGTFGDIFFSPSPSFTLQ